MVPAHIIFIACCYSYILFSICYRTGNPNPNKTKKNYITNRRNKYIYYDNLPFTLKSILKMCLLDSFIYFTLLLVYSYQLKYFCQVLQIDTICTVELFYKSFLSEQLSIPTKKTINIGMVLPVVYKKYTIEET